MSETKNVKNEILTKDIIWSKISDKYNREISNEGCYVLRTDLTSLSDVEIWETYNMLTRLDCLALLNMLIMIFIKNWMLSLTELKLKGIFIKNL
jgi:hypothetical protein